MKLIAKKPCSFGGKKFFIGEEVPVNLVANPALQEKLGVIAIDESKDKKAPVVIAGTFTQEQVNSMVAEAVAKAVAETEKKRDEQLAELQKYTAELEETEPGAYDGTIQIVIKGVSEGENEQLTIVPTRADEIQQVFSIMQMSADEGAKEIAEVKSENVLILLHATDSRKTIKNAAKEQADKLFSVMEGAGG